MVRSRLHWRRRGPAVKRRAVGAQPIEAIRARLERVVTHGRF
jgi:hypothetical protein